MKLLRSKKGFTLMEIIVVLIIIAIMAAALIPSFVNFARNARANEYIAQARIGMSAAQAFVTDEGARGTPIGAAAAPAATSIRGMLADAFTVTTDGGAAANANYRKFALNIIGDVENRYGFESAVIAEPEMIGPNAFDSFRVIGITYRVAPAGPDWIVRIDDEANTTEYWRPGVAFGSEGTGRP